MVTAQMDGFTAVLCIATAAVGAISSKNIASRKTAGPRPVSRLHRRVSTPLEEEDEGKLMNAAGQCASHRRCAVRRPYWAPTPIEIVGWHDKRHTRKRALQNRVQILKRTR